MTRHAGWVLAAMLCGAAATGARAEEVGCVSSTFRLLGPNDKICVEAFPDPKILGVTCHISQARTGGVKGGLGLAEDPSRFSLACRQTGPIAVPDRLPDQEEVFTARTSILFKQSVVVRMWDKAHNTLVYLVYSTKLVDGSPQNSISTVPIQSWK